MTWAFMTWLEEFGTEEPPADVTLDAFLDAFEAEKLASEQNEEIEDEVPTVELELIMVSDMMTFGAKIYDGKGN